MLAGLLCAVVAIVLLEVGFAIGRRKRSDEEEHLAVGESRGVVLPVSREAAVQKGAVASERTEPAYATLTSEIIAAAVEAGVRAALRSSEPRGESGSGRLNVAARHEPELPEFGLSQEDGVRLKIHRTENVGGEKSRDELGSLYGYWEGERFRVATLNINGTLPSTTVKNMVERLKLPNHIEARLSRVLADTILVVLEVKVPSNWDARISPRVFSTNELDWDLSLIPRLQSTPPGAQVSFKDGAPPCLRVLA